MFCAYEGDRVARHEAIHDALYKATVCASLAPTKEGSFLLPGGDKRPADVLIPHWTAGQDTALEVIIVHPLQVLPPTLQAWLRLDRGIQPKDEEDG